MYTLWTRRSGYTICLSPGSTTLPSQVASPLRLIDYQHSQLCSGTSGPNVETANNGRQIGSADLGWESAPVCSTLAYLEPVSTHGHIILAHCSSQVWLKSSNEASMVAVQLVKPWPVSISWPETTDQVQHEITTNSKALKHDFRNP